MKCTLYSTDCPKCKVLKKKLDDAGVAYELCTDVEIMESKGFMQAPMLEVDDNTFDFINAINWVRHIEE